MPRTRTLRHSCCLTLAPNRLHLLHRHLQRQRQRRLFRRHQHLNALLPVLLLVLVLLVLLPLLVRMMMPSRRFALLLLLLPRGDIGAAMRERVRVCHNHRPHNLALWMRC